MKINWHGGNKVDTGQKTGMKDAGTQQSSKRRTDGLFTGETDIPKSGLTKAVQTDREKFTRQETVHYD